ncbi:4'-phosphopantetheinyl transferase superfamily protein [uncultured Streptomyces sp.]|uniref:4'-phosphopantetheinyl transferase family protein n=1 Tax=uncultured Streptomyces sp. TaxID=174707 RepID=UPI00261715AB|nr:4'-phosphopantetheinyl transferase superfamily protein [uncultured Streptomyces sp.]
MNAPAVLRPDPWTGPPSRPAAPGPVPRLWLVGAAAFPAHGPTVLDAAERRRADAFRRPADRAVYVAAHQALRQVLGAHLDTDPAAVEMTRLPCPGCGAPHGRPAVAGPAGDRLHFSLSHTHGLALIAVADAPVGADIEQLPDPELIEDVAAVLHPTEREELARAGAGSRPAAFARCWTRKEAYVKTTGEGLSGPSVAGVYLGCGPHPAAPPGWTVADVEVPAGYAAACAVGPVDA